MGDWRRSACLSLMLDQQSADPTNLRTLDSSGNRLHAGYTAGASAPTKIAGQRGYNFNGAQYFSGLCDGKFNQSAISIGMLFKPNFESDDGLGYYLIDTTTGSRYHITKATTNTLNIFFGNTLVLNPAFAVFGPYWKVGQYNTLIASGVSGNNFLLLNNHIVATSATVWGAVDPIEYWIGRRYTAVQFWDGDIHQAEVFPFAMTQTQADDWAIRAMQRVNAL